jgi:hypothetical protein
MLRSLTIAVTMLGGLTMNLRHFTPLVATAQGEDVQFDVNDVSYLWPAPKTKEDVASLISADELIEDGSSPIWPKDVFGAVIGKAQTITIANSIGGTNRIDFATFVGSLSQPSNWKIVAFRVDPSAPGASTAVISVFGSSPQLRLIVQPVTIDDKSGAVRVHDVTAHLVFSFVKGFDPPLSAGGPPRAIPDREKFGSLVGDLKALKATLHAANVETAGKLTVHPGFQKNIPGFSDKIRAFLKKYIRPDRLGAVAFMGIEPPEPWIFFAMSKKADRTMFVPPHPVLGDTAAQMLTFQGGTPVMPQPKTTNIDLTRGVSTSMLLPSATPEKLNSVVFNDLPRPLHKDIPDIIANPQRSNFFNTDCISCHSESSRRKELQLNVTDNQFRYILPNSISGVDENILPKNQWNVRNFGWFPDGPSPTATMRTENESAESADYMNREYLTPKK